MAARKKWFSAVLKYIILIELEGGCTIYESLRIFRALDFETAFKRALELGFSYETEYKNDFNQTVIWKFSEILTLDIIEKGVRDGVEVHSKFVELEEEDRILLDAEFRPENSKPTQTI